MIKPLPNEKWKEIKMDRSVRLRYAISNQGRLMSFVDNMKDGRLLSGGEIEGYRIFRYKVYDKNKTHNQHHFFHRLVGEYFCAKKSKKQEYVIHLDRNRRNNAAKNLKWATKEEMIEHNKKSPAVIRARKKLIEFNRNAPGHKLTAAKVKTIKEKIFNPNRKAKMADIAAQFDISEMQLYRIKSGENWGHVKIDKSKFKK